MKLIYTVLFLCLFSFVEGQAVTINEVVSKNESGPVDEDGDYSDWIELYNTTSSIQNLSAYSLHDSNSSWDLPNIVINPNSYLIVYASGKDKVANQLHTNFKLDSDGENISLYSVNQLVISIDLPELRDGLSLASIPDGSKEYYIVTDPSPGTSNLNEDVIVFSEDAGFYRDSLLVNITSLLDYDIRFTTDGSDPTFESELWTDNKVLYQKSSANILCTIPTTAVDQTKLSYKAWTLPNDNIDKCHIIKAASFSDDIIQSKIYTRSYFIDSPIRDIPVISIQMSYEDLFDENIGIYVPGNKLDQSNPEWTGNFFESGHSWERPSAVTYFDKDGNVGFTQKLGVRVHGGKTRQAVQKSLKFYAREEYGKKEIQYSLFSDREQDSYKRFILRSTMGSWNGDNLINDELSHEIIKELDIDHQKRDLVLVYINGEYWGIHNITERQDEHFIEYISGIDNDSVDIVGFWDKKLDSVYFFAENNHLDLLAENLDIPSFIDYYVAQMFFGNRDWPDNNSKLWSKYNDRFWRYLFYDIDAGYGKPDVNMYNHIEDSDLPDKASIIFRVLTLDTDYKKRFLERLSELLLTEFLSSTTVHKVQLLVNGYKPYLQEHIDRWDYPNSINEWEQDVEDNIIDFLKERPCHFIEQTKEYFKLEEFVPSCEDLREIEASPDLSHISISPTICNQYFNIVNDSDDPVIYQLKIYNSMGQLTFAQSQVYIYKHESKEISFDLPSGYYIVQLSDYLDSHAFKILVEN